MFVATGLLALRGSELPRRRKQVITVVGLAGSAAALGLAVTRPSQPAVAAASIWTGVLLLATVIVIVRRILSFATVTVQSIYAAISAYLILGLMFAAFYAAVALLHHGQFFADGRAGDSRIYQYFSFTTLTTLGYGDYTASGSGGQAIAVLEALTGQIFLATLVARLVAAFRGPGATPVTADDSPVSSGGPSSSETQPDAADPAAQASASSPQAGPRPAERGQGRPLPRSMRPGRRPRRPPDPAARARQRRPRGQ